MKYTREEMYQSACNDSEKMFKLKAMDYLEWLVENYYVSFTPGGSLAVQGKYYGHLVLPEAIRAAIKEVCKL